MGCPPGYGKPGPEEGQRSVLPTQRRYALHWPSRPLEHRVDAADTVIAHPTTRPTRRAGSETNGRARTPQAPARTSPALRKAGPRRTIRPRRALLLLPAAAAVALVADMPPWRRHQRARRQGGLAASLSCRGRERRDG